MEIIGGLLAGAFIGAVLGFIGAGGAMLSVPILLYIFDFTPQAATTAATSAGIISFVSTEAAAAYTATKRTATWCGGQAHIGQRHRAAAKLCLPWQCATA